MNLYSIKDVKVGAFGTVFQAPHEAVAVRQVMTELSRKDSSLSKFASDFELWTLGSFDPASGILKSDLQMVSSITAISASLANEVENG